MISDVGILQELIKREALVTVEKDAYDNNSLELKEPAEGESLGYKIIICNPPQDTIAIKSDMFSFPEKMFRSTRGECKKADYVIIASDGEKNWIVYIEMKHGKHGQGGHIIQGNYTANCTRPFDGSPEFLTETLLPSPVAPIPEASMFADALRSA